MTAATTTVSYRIHNISGVVTHHSRQFRTHLEAGAFIRTQLDRKPWVSHVTVKEAK